MTTIFKVFGVFHLWGLAGLLALKTKRKEVVVLSLEKFLRLVAWGGCTVSKLPVPIYPYSIVCHTHKDHIPKSENIIVVGPVAFLRRSMKSKIPVDPDDSRGTTISCGSVKARIYVLGRKTLGEMGVEKRLHVFPVLVQVEDEMLLYIDDFNLGDVSEIKKILKHFRETLGDVLRMAILPVYSGAKAHGAEEGPELAEASKELMMYAMSLGVEVIAFAHPVIPNWVPEDMIKLHKTVKTIK